MPHLDDLTLMMYLDAELSAEETEQAATHLIDCPFCREQLSRFRTDEDRLGSMFSNTSPEAPPPLHAFTLVQIEAIASLHRRQQNRTFWQLLHGLGVLSASISSYWLFLQSDLYLWLSQIWAGWRYDVFWSAAFWLKEMAEHLLLRPEYGLMQVGLLVLVLAVLLLLHSRQATALTPHKQREGGQQS